MRHLALSICCSLIANLLVTTPRAVACPRISGLIDYNCDQQLRYVFIGDSVVFGRGDSRFGNKGGYVRRLRSRFPGTTMVNLGKPGYTTARLLSWFKRQYRRTNSSTHLQTRNADSVFIDVGRNDFFEDASPAFTQRNVKRLATYMRDNLGKALNVKPIISIATLLPSKGRPIQQLFIDDVNEQFLRAHGSSFPVRLRFDRLAQGLIDQSGIHPRSQGYDKLTSILRGYILGKLQTRSSRTDADGDGVYDIFEVSRFGTNPNLADTDGDSISDGEELFTTLTDPLTP